MDKLAELAANNAGFVGFTGDQKVVNLEKKSLAELELMLKQREKMLANRRIISQLPDRGNKLLISRDEIAACIRRKRVLEETTSLLVKLKLNDKIVPNQPTLETKEIEIEQPSGSDGNDLFAKVLAEAIDQRNNDNQEIKFKPNMLAKEIRRDKNEMEVETTETKKKQLTERRFKFDAALEDSKSKLAVKQLTVEESLSLAKEQAGKEKIVSAARSTEVNKVMSEKTILNYLADEDYLAECLSDVDENDDENDE